MSFSPDSTHLENADASIARAQASIQRVREILQRMDGDGPLRVAVEAQLAEMLESLDAMRAVRHGMTSPPAT